MAATKVFNKVNITRTEPTPAYDMWVAVWKNRGRGEVMLGAPTLDELAARWEQITSSDFDRSIAQRVCGVGWQDTDSVSGDQK